MIRSAILATVLAVAIPVPAQDAGKEAVAKAVASIQGTWLIVTINGQSLGDAGMEMSLTFTDDKYAQTTNGNVDERGTIKIDPAKKPMTIDLNITEGNDAGKLQLGIFEITGDTMTMKLGAPADGIRPTGLSQSDGTLFVIFKKKAK